MNKNKDIEKLNSLIQMLKDLDKAEDFDDFLENNDIELQEIFWACEYYLKEYKKLLEKN